MRIKTSTLCWASIVSAIMLCATPVLSSGAGDTGRDWYCSDPDAHTKAYQKHVKQHLDRGAVVIADKLEEIYSDQSLSKEEKRAKTLAVLNDHLATIKVGMGD